MYAADKIFKKALLFSFVLHGIFLIILQSKLSPLPSSSPEVYQALNISVALNPPAQEKTPVLKKAPLEKPAAEESPPEPPPLEEIAPVEEIAPLIEAPAAMDSPAAVESPIAVEAPAAVAMKGPESQSVENPVSLPQEPSYSGERLDSLSFDNARMPVPVYPSRAKKMEWEGDVTVSFVINEKGKVDSLVIEESSGYEMLDKSVADTVKKGWRFPRRDGALRVWKTFSFRLI